MKYNNCMGFVVTHQVIQYAICVFFALSFYLVECATSAFIFVNISIVLSSNFANIRGHFNFVGFMRDGIKNDEEGGGMRNSFSPFL